LIIVFGGVIALLSWTPLFTIFNGLVNSTFWPRSGPDAGAQAFMLWAYGMLGATMVGWGIFLAYIVRYPLAKKERWARDCIAIGVAVWFLIDTSMSVWMQAYFNVAINVLLVFLVAVPLLATKDLFIKFQMKQQ
jgi:hypothetical protein